MFGALNSAIAISAALRMACPATPALPGADSGRRSPALTWPVPMVAPGGACPLSGGGVDDRYCEFCEQPATRTPAEASSPAIERRRVGKITGVIADGSTFDCDDTMVLLTAPNLKPGIGAGANKASPI